MPTRVSVVLLLVLVACAGTTTPPTAAEHPSRSLERSSQQDLPAATQVVDPATLTRWMLFGEAESIVTGTLKPPYFRSNDGTEFYLKGQLLTSSGWVVSTTERARVSQLVGLEVVAAVREKDWRFAVCTHECWGIGPADAPEWKEPAAAFRLLNDDPEWRTKALALERGTFDEFANACWREGNADGIRAAVAKLTTGVDRIALARDIVGWFTRTVDTPFPEIELVRVEFGKEGQQGFTTLRDLAVQIAKTCLGVPFAKPGEQLDNNHGYGVPAPRFARRLWILMRMRELVPSSEQASPTQRSA